MYLNLKISDNEVWARDLVPFTQQLYLFFIIKIIYKLKVQKIKYFISEPIEWKDEHGGIKSSGFSYNYILLTEDGQFVFLTRNTEDFDIINFFNDKSSAELKKDTSVMYGSYKIENDVLTYSYQILGIDYSGQFTFLSPTIILDKNLREYKIFFRPKLIGTKEEE